MDPIEKAIYELKQVQKNAFLSKQSIFSEDITKIIQRLEDKSFRVAVVGEFSSGKSTFLNALMKKDLLKHGAKETTATITELVHVGEGEETGAFDVYYLDGTQQTGVPFQELEQYTAASSRERDVAGEIGKVVVKSHVLDLGCPICFVDTPGLNGMADHHREKTMEQVKNAHACIYLLPVRGIGQSDIEFIQLICAYQRNFIFIQNFTDEIKKLEGETPEQKIAEQKRILEEKVFPGNTEVSYSLVGISARKALLAADAAVKAGGMDRDGEARERLYQESNFEAALEEIKKLAAKNEKEAIQKKASISAGIGILQQILGVLSFHQKQEQAEWELSPEAQASRGYEKLKERLLGSWEKNRENMSDFVLAEIARMKRDSRKKIEEEIVKIPGLVEEQLKDKTKLEELEQFIESNGIGDILNEGVQGIEKSSIDLLDASFDNLLSNATLRIQEYTGNYSSNRDVPKFEKIVPDDKDEYPNFDRDEDEIKRTEKEIAKSQAEREKDRQEREQKQLRIKEIASNIEENKSTMDLRWEQKKDELFDLGERPDYEIKYKEEAYEESREGFWGKFVDFFVGPMLKTKKVPYRDYSKTYVWDRKKEEIKDKYSQEENKFRAAERMLKRKMEECQEDVKEIEKMEPLKQQRLFALERQLAKMKEELETKRKLAQTEYMQSLKKKVRQEVKDYLYGEESVKDYLVSYMEGVIDANGEEIEKYILQLYKMSLDARIAALERLLSDEKGKHAAEKSMENISIVNRTIEKLEECLCQL